MAATPATTSGAAIAPADLVAALAALQACIATAEAKAQQTRAAVAALELQLTNVLSIAVPPCSATPAPTAPPATAAARGQASPAVDVFDAFSVGYLHAQAASIQDIRPLVPVVLSVTSTQYHVGRQPHLLVLKASKCCLPFEC
jgi:hypothetical protein